MAEKKDKKNTFNTHLYECCGDDELRPILQCIQFKHGFAYASNGIISIKQTLDLQSVLNKELLEGQLLHRDNYKSIMAFEIAECNIDGIYCKNLNGQTAFFSYFDRSDNTVPDLEKAMNNRSLTSLSFVGIDPKQLMKLSKALYNPSNNLRFQFTGIDKAIMVDAVGIEEQEGLMMPLILNDTLFG